MSKQTNMTSIF